MIIWTIIGGNYLMSLVHHAGAVKIIMFYNCPINTLNNYHHQGDSDY